MCTITLNCYKLHTISMKGTEKRPPVSNNILTDDKLHNVTLHKVIPWILCNKTTVTYEYTEMAKIISSLQNNPPNIITMAVLFPVSLLDKYGHYSGFLLSV